MKITIGRRTSRSTWLYGHELVVYVSHTLRPIIHTLHVRPDRAKRTKILVHVPILLKSKKE
jgi:hypothetical protein